MSTVFTKIINGELPSYKIYEDDIGVAFLDINPIQKGQVILVPYQEIDPIYNLPEVIYRRLFERAGYIAKLLEVRLKCKRVCLVVEGYEIPHAHIKLIPTNSPEDLHKEPYSASKEELEEMYKLLTP